MIMFKIILTALVLSFCLCDPVSPRMDVSDEKNVEIKFHRTKSYPNGIKCTYTIWVLENTFTIDERPFAIHCIGDTSHSYYQVTLPEHQNVILRAYYIYKIPGDTTYYKVTDTLTLEYDSIENNTRIWWYLKSVTDLII